MLPGQTPSVGQVVAADSAGKAPAAPPAAPTAQVPPATEPGQVPPSVGADPAAPTSPRTAEEVDAFWRNRVSQKDRAHAEAERALREELESLKRYQAQAATSSDGQPSNEGKPTGPDPRVAQLQNELEAERAARLIDKRKAQYSHLAAAGATDDIFKVSDEATLAKLNALANDDDSGGTFIAPTGPRRAAPTTPKPLHEKSKDELLADLKAASPGYEEWARSQRR